MTTADVCAHLGVAPRTVQRLIRRGLPAHRVGGRRYVMRDELDAYLRSQPA